MKLLGWYANNRSGKCFDGRTCFLSDPYTVQRNSVENTYGAECLKCCYAVDMLFTRHCKHFVILKAVIKAIALVLFQFKAFVVIFKLWFMHLQLAQKELRKINTYKAPRDKLVCILNCCRIINNLLVNVSMASNDNPPGADDFLPVLIYVVIKVRQYDMFSCRIYFWKLWLRWTTTISFYVEV